MIFAFLKERYIIFFLKGLNMGPNIKTTRDHGLTVQ